MPRYEACNRLTKIPLNMKSKSLKNALGLFNSKSLVDANSFEVLNDKQLQKVKGGKINPDCTCNGGSTYIDTSSCTCNGGSTYVRTLESSY